MTEAFTGSVHLDRFPFRKETKSAIFENRWVRDQWPVVYFIENRSKRLAYVGESTNVRNRINSHLDNEKRAQLNQITIIGSPYVSG